MVSINYNRMSIAPITIKTYSRKVEKIVNNGNLGSKDKNDPIRIEIIRNCWKHTFYKSLVCN